jgi:hypothetical protein
MGAIPIHNVYVVYIFSVTLKVNGVNINVNGGRQVLKGVAARPDAAGS